MADVNPTNFSSLSSSATTPPKRFESYYRIKNVLSGIPTLDSDMAEHHSNSSLGPSLLSQEDDKGSGDSEVQSPWNISAFVRRVQTFNEVMWWFAKPLPLSPLECARRGWINTAEDTISCLCCEARLLVDIDSALDPIEAKGLVEIYAEKLCSTHAPRCPWLNNPCPEFFVNPLLGSPLDARQIFLRRLAAISAHYEHIPLLSLEGDGEDKNDQMMQLNELVQQPFVAKALATYPPDVWPSMCLVALGGWSWHADPALPSPSISSSSSLECTLCQRVLRLDKYSALSFPRAELDGDIEGSVRPVRDDTNEGEEEPSVALEDFGFRSPSASFSLGRPMDAKQRAAVLLGSTRRFGSPSSSSSPATQVPISSLITASPHTTPLGDQATPVKPTHQSPSLTSSHTSLPPSSPSPLRHVSSPSTPLPVDPAPPLTTPRDRDGLRRTFSNSSLNASLSSSNPLLTGLNSNSKWASLPPASSSPKANPVSDAVGPKKKRRVYEPFDVAFEHRVFCPCREENFWRNYGELVSSKSNRPVGLPRSSSHHSLTSSLLSRSVPLHSSESKDEDRGSGSGESVSMNTDMVKNIKSMLNSLK